MSGAGNEKLRAFLAGRDVPCPSCGYNLRNLKASVCPECGWAISYQKLMEDEAHRQWRESRMPLDRITTVGLIGSILGMGWPVASVIAAGVFHGNRWPPGAGLAAVMGVTALVQLGMVLLYLERGAKIVGWPRRRKVLLAVLAWCWGPLVLAAVVAFGMARLYATGGGG